MKRNFLILLTMFLLVTPVILMADVDTVLDTIYTEESVPLKESVWLVLVGAEKLSSESDLSDADPYLKEKKWSGTSTLSKGQLAVLLMDNFDLPQGVMYRLTGSPRYALKDLVYYGLINGGGNLKQNVSGFDLVNSLNTVLEEEQS